jgi:hypothetical protein
MEFSGVIENGKLIIRNRAGMDAYLALQRDGQRMRVRITRQKRSLSQNAYFHGVVVPLLAMAAYLDNYSMKAFLKLKFLGEREVEVNGERRMVLRSTADLDTEEFSRFLAEIDAWAATEMHVAIPQPGE